MQENKYAFSGWKYTGIAILFIAVMAILLFRIEDNYQICLLLFAAGLAMVRPLPFGQWTMLDSCLSLITVYDAVSCLYAGCLVPAIYSTLLSIFCLTAYFVLRKLFTSKYATRIILQGSYLPIGIALLLAISSFFIFRQSVLSVGFQDTYHFRFLFRPLGYITNIWAEILLLLLGWVCIVRRNSGLFIFLTILAILFSFSRGAYIALGIFIVAWLLLVKPKREKLRLLIVGVIAIALTSIFFLAEMKTTLLMNRTTSQQQSTKGRITATQAGLETYRKHSLFGYGNGNYTFAVDSSLNQVSTLPYTSCAPNILIQLLIEKGIVGILLYLMLAIAICRTIIKRRKQPESRMIACVMLALVTKEMTQATLLDTPFALLMFYVLLASLQKEEVLTEENKNRQTASNYLIPAIVSVCYLGWIVFNYQQNQYKLRQQQSMAAWDEGKFTEAISLMRQTGRQTSTIINQGLLYMHYYQKTGDIGSLQSAEQLLQQADRYRPEDVQIRYLLTRLYIYAQKPEKAFPIAKELAVNYSKNSLYLSALSDILYQQGDKEAALQLLIKAIRYTPRLLTGQRIRNLQQNDRAFYNILQQHLSTLTPSPEDGPADYARYGYIAKWCGNKSISNKYLRKAVNELPNLATPWHLLGDDNKYRLLLYGAFHKELLSIELPEEKEVSDELLFKVTYQAKFENWYGSELVSP
jgi:O-antigen ligase